jgi:hypothetical protein
VEILLNKTLVTAVIDTGAKNSLISYDLALRCGLEVSNEPKTFRVIGQQYFQTVGTAKCDLVVDGVVMQAPQLVVFPGNANTDISLLLGIDFLKMNRIELCISKRLLVRHYDNGSTAEIYLNRLGESLRVMLCSIPCIATDDVRLEVGKVQDVPMSCQLPVVNNDHMLLYSDKCIDRSLYDRVRGLEGVANREARSILMVAPETATQIRKGQVVGTLSSVFQVSESEEPVSSCNAPTDFDPISQIVLPELSVEQRDAVFKMFGVHKSVFSTGDTDVGLAGVTKHQIRLTNETPIYQRPRRFPQPIADEIERQCKELNSLDIIEPSVSPWSSPVVPVRKKDGSVRMCIDYRQLNRVTIPDKFPVPNLSDSIFGLHGTKFFTRLDLVRGYYQLPID